MKRLFILFIAIMLIFTGCEIYDNKHPGLLIQDGGEHIYNFAEEYIFNYQIPNITGCQTHALLVDSYGTLWGYGSNQYGQLGIDDFDMVTSEPVEIMGNVAAALCVDNRSIALMEDGRVMLWGLYAFDEPTEIIKNAAGIHLKMFDAYIYQNDGSLWRFYSKWHPDETMTIKRQLLLDKVLYDVKQVFFESHATFAIKNDNSLWGWGANSGGIIGNGLTSRNQVEPYKILDNVKQVSANLFHTLAVTNNNELWGWGYNGSGQLNEDINAGTVYYPKKIMDDVIKAYTFNYTSFVIKKDGTLYAFGENKNGEFGDGTKESKKYHTPILNNISDIYLYSNNDYFSIYALNNNGLLYGWGKDMIYPKVIAEDVKYVCRQSISNGYPCLIKKDNTLWVWGNNPFFKTEFEKSPNDFRIASPVMIDFF